MSRMSEAKTIAKQSAFGHPMSHLNETTPKKIVGRVIGVAARVHSSSVEDRETGEIKVIKSLGGSFKMIPLDETKNITTSAKLGLPAHIIQPIIDALESDNTAIVEIALDVGVEAAKNPAGYSWYGVPLMDASASDPLAALEARISGKLALEAPKAVKAEPEAHKSKK